MELRPSYQVQPINDVRNSYRQGKQRPCVVLPCGAGKSCLMAYMAKQVTNKGNFVLLILHRNELKMQLTQTFIDWGVNMNLVLIGMVQSMRNHLGKIPIPTLIICEECHHCTAKTYREVFDYYPETKGVFFTATPIRLNNGGLGDVCDDLIVGVSAKWLIANGYLALYKHYSVPVADFSTVKTIRGEYDNLQLSEIMENNRIYGDTIENYRRLADGTKTIAYCSSVKAAYETAEEFRKRGYLAEALDGKSDKKRRLEVMERFRSGEVQILTNNLLFGEGLDVPDCETILLLKKTKSLTLYIQMAMRSMRIDKNNPNKIAKIIDYCGNVYEHGFVDADREWSLETKPKKITNEIKIKTCPSCYAVIEQNKLTCPYCEHDFTAEVKKRMEAERIQAELAEVQAIELETLRNMPYSKVKEFSTWDEIVKYQQAKKYKFFWCLRTAKINKVEIPDKYKYLERMVN